MSDKDKQAREQAEAEVNERIEATLSNPKLVSALAELRAMTPAGEKLFGFKVEPADARAKVPSPERVDLVEGAAIVTDTEAAAAYVGVVAPAAAVSPRMPTGKVRFAQQAAAADPRRQATQPSIAKGGQGPRPPALEGEADETTPAVLERLAMPPATRTAQEPPSRGSRESLPRRGWAAIALGFALAASLALALLLRTPRGVDPSGASATTTASAPAPPISASERPTAGPATVAPAPPAPATATATASSAPEPAPTKPILPAPPISPQPLVAPPSPRDPSALPTSKAPAAATAAPARTADPVTPPAPTVAPSAAPGVPQPTSKPLIYD